jgi:hypothetical protein
MKKLLLVLLLLTGFNIHSQKYNTQKRQLEQKLKTELKIDYDSLDTTKIKKIRDQITFLKRKANNENIDKTETVIYDFQTKKYINSLVIPIVGEPIVLKIININRLAYDVSIKSSDVAIVDEYFDDEIKTAVRKTNDIPINLIPVVEKNINIPIIENTKKTESAEDLKKIENYTKEITEKKNAILEVNEKIINYEKIIIDKNKAQINLLSLTDTLGINKNNKKEINDLKFTVLTTEKDIELGKNQILKYENEIKENENKILNLKSNSAIVIATFSKLNSDYLKILNQYLKIKNIESEYQDYKQLALNPLSSYDSYNKKKDVQDFIINNLTTYKNEIFEFNKLMSAFNNNFYSSVNNYSNIFDSMDKDKIEYIKLKYQQIKDEVDKIKSNTDALDLPTKLLKVESINTILSNNKAYEIVSSPIQPFEDYVTFDVIIKNRDSNKLSEYDDNREFTYMEYTQGGVRFDFSTGVVINFGGNNNKYQISNIKVDEGGIQVDKKQIVLADKNEFTPMLSAMFHTSFRRNGIWAFGLTLGASINVETFQLNSLFPGISLLIGKKQKFILSVGPAFRQVDVLKNNYKTETTYDTTEFNDTSELTSKQFKIGCFAGITYNLTQKQRGKFKINGNE